MQIIEPMGGRGKRPSVSDEVQLRQALSERDAEIAKLKKLLESEMEQTKTLKEECRRLKKERDEAVTQLNTLLREKNSLIEKNSILLNRINALEAELRELKSSTKNKSQPFSLDDVPEDIGDDLIASLLSPAEYKIYQLRKQKYLDEFEINSSSDMVLLQDLLFHEIMHLRLLKQKASDPQTDITVEIENCVSRIQKNLDALGMLRKQRLSQKEQIVASIADLVQQFDKEKAIRQAKQYEEEEKSELLKKQERDKKVVDYDSAVEMFKQVFGQRENG